jgi:hypothetical protein
VEDEKKKMAGMGVPTTDLTTANCIHVHTSQTNIVPFSVLSNDWNLFIKFSQDSG